ncbi:MAG: hypothetical protein AAF757_19920 [Cyanobacteria bacterium P01_D01_bin.116]
MGNEYKLVDGYLRKLIASIRHHSLIVVQKNTRAQVKTIAKSASLNSQKYTFGQDI